MPSLKGEGPGGIRGGNFRGRVGGRGGEIYSHGRMIPQTRPQRLKNSAKRFGSDVLGGKPKAVGKAAGGVGAGLAAAASGGKLAKSKSNDKKMLQSAKSLAAARARTAKSKKK